MLVVLGIVFVQVLNAPAGSGGHVALRYAVLVTGGHRGGQDPVGRDVVVGGQVAVGQG